MKSKFFQNLFNELNLQDIDIKKKSKDLHLYLFNVSQKFNSYKTNQKNIIKPGLTEVAK